MMIVGHAPSSRLCAHRCSRLCRRWGPKLDNHRQKWRHRSKTRMVSKRWPLRSVSVVVPDREAA